MEVFIICYFVLGKKKTSATFKRWSLHRLPSKTGDSFPLSTQGAAVLEFFMLTYWYPSSLTCGDFFGGREGNCVSCPVSPPLLFWDHQTSGSVFSQSRFINEKLSRNHLLTPLGPRKHQDMTPSQLWTVPTMLSSHLTTFSISLWQSGSQQIIAARLLNARHLGSSQ